LNDQFDFTEFEDFKRFAPAIIGEAHGKIVYSREGIIDILAEEIGDWDEAIEWYRTNIEDADITDRTPIYVTESVLDIENDIMEIYSGEFIHIHKESDMYIVTLPHMSIYIHEGLEWDSFKRDLEKLVEKLNGVKDGEEDLSAIRDFVNRIDTNKFR